MFKKLLELRQKKAEHAAEMRPCKQGTIPRCPLLPLVFLYFGFRFLLA